MQGFPESTSMSLHLRLRISPFRIPVVGREDEERPQLEISLLIADADHLNNLLGLWKSVAARRLLLLRNDAHWVLVVFFEADGVVECTAKNRPALVDARCGKAFRPQIRE